MGAIVSFDYNAWTGMFPEFTAVNTSQATGFFNRATKIFRNDGGGPVCDAAEQSDLLNLLTAHIAWLNAFRDASGMPSSTGTIPPSPIVGRINSASQGSVSLGADMGDATAGSPSQPWYMQSRYGAEFWAATAGYRTAQYAAQPTIVAGPVFPGYFPGRRWGGL